MCVTVLTILYTYKTKVTCSSMDVREVIWFNTHYSNLLPLKVCNPITNLCRLVLYFQSFKDAYKL